MGGSKGKDMYFSVPLGTEVYEIKKGTPSKSLITSVRIAYLTSTRMKSSS